MANFRNINYGRLLYETLRAYYSVNSSGDITIAYKFLIAIIQILQLPFDEYDVYRIKESIIAGCKWQNGQLTNVLNHLYDPILSRIFITQAALPLVSDPTFSYVPYNFDETFSDSPPATTIFEHPFNDRATIVLVTIHVPTGTNISDLTATVNQIKLTGITYEIVTF